MCIFRKAGSINRMDRLHLIKRLAERHVQLKTKDAEYSVRVILDAMCSTLARGGRIEIRGFGSFSLTRHPPKQKRNPRIGHKLKEPAKYIPHFKPAKELRARTNKDDGTTITEICRPLPMPSELLNHKEANDLAQTGIYA